MSQAQASSTLLRIGTGLLAVVLLVAAVGVDAAPVVARKKKAPVVKTSAAVQKPVVAPSLTKDAPIIGPALRTQVAAPPRALARPFTIGVSLARTRSLYDYQDGTLKESTDVGGSLGLSLTDLWKVSLKFAYSQDERDSEASGWGDTSISVSRKASTFSNFTMAPAMTVTAPTSKDSGTRQNMTGALTGSLKFGFAEGVLAEGFSLGAGLSLTRIFHDYDTAIDGKVNTQWSSSQSLSAGYKIGDFSISASFAHKNGLSYQDQLRENFEHSEEIAWQGHKNVSFAIGHALSGSALKANGVDSNLSLMNENNSMVYGSISASY